MAMHKILLSKRVLFLSVLKKINKNKILLYEKDCTESTFRYGHSMSQLSSGGPYLMDAIQAVQVYAKARAKSVSNQGAISPSSVFYAYPVKTEGICEPCLEDLEKVSSSFESSQIALSSTKYSEKMQNRSHLFGCLFLPFSSLFQ